MIENGGFSPTAVAEAVLLGQVPEVALPWVRVVAMAIAGALPVSGSYDLIRKFTGNGER